MPEVQNYVQEAYPKQDRPPTLAKFVAAQAQGLTCKQHAASMGHQDSKFFVDNSALLVKQSTMNGAI